MSACRTLEVQRTVCKHANITGLTIPSSFLVLPLVIRTTETSGPAIADVHASRTGSRNIANLPLLQERAPLRTWCQRQNRPGQIDRRGHSARSHRRPRHTIRLAASNRMVSLSCDRCANSCCEFCTLDIRQKSVPLLRATSVAFNNPGRFLQGLAPNCSAKHSQRILRRRRAFPSCDKKATLGPFGVLVSNDIQNRLRVWIIHARRLAIQPSDKALFGMAPSVDELSRA